MKSKVEKIEQALEALESAKINQLEVCSRLTLIYTLGGVLEKVTKDLAVILEPAGGFRDKDKFIFGQLKLYASKVKESTLNQLQTEESKQDFKLKIDFLSNLCLDSLLRAKTTEDMLMIESTVKNYFKPKFK